MLKRRFILFQWYNKVWYGLYEKYWAPPFLEVGFPPFFEVSFPRKQPLSPLGRPASSHLLLFSRYNFYKCRPFFEVKNLRGLRSVDSVPCTLLPVSRYEIFRIFKSWDRPALSLFWGTKNKFIKSSWPRLFHKYGPFLEVVWRKLESCLVNSAPLFFEVRKSPKFYKCQPFFEVQNYPNFCKCWPFFEVQNLREFRSVPLIPFPVLPGQPCSSWRRLSSYRIFHKYRPFVEVVWRKMESCLVNSAPPFFEVRKAPNFCKCRQTILGTDKLILIHPSSDSSNYPLKFRHSV